MGNEYHCRTKDGSTGDLFFLSINNFALNETFKLQLINFSPVLPNLNMVKRKAKSFHF